jgi:galactosylceramidase
MAPPAAARLLAGGRCLALAAAVAAAASPPTSTTPIALDGATALHRFDGIGALSAGASSRLLLDYPDSQRGEIHD